MNIRELRIGDYVIYEGEFHKAECLFGKCEGVLLYGVDEILDIKGWSCYEKGKMAH